MIHGGIELLFDDAGEAAILELQARFAAAGLGRSLPDWGHRPHLSLLGGGVPEDGFEEALAAFARATPALDVTLGTISTFASDEGVVFLGPRVDRALLDLHRAAFDALAPFLPELGAFGRPESWAPHCTVTVGLDDAHWSEAVGLCRSLPLPFRGRLARIAIHDVEIDPEQSGWDRLVGGTYRDVRALDGE